MSSGIYSFFTTLSPRNLSLVFTRMRGLTNYHLSCCVNSLLQTLSATCEITDLLERWDVAGVRGDGRNVPLHLKRALAAMRADVPQPAPHCDFLHCLDQNCFRLNVQHDADEVFFSILNFIQQQMDDKALAQEIQNLYKISVETYLQCLECNSVQTRTSYMLSLPLYVKEDHNSLEGCMNSFFEHQELRGINCCFCVQCETKKPSKQGIKLLSLPRILCMNLKRFRNRCGFTRKLDCMVTFPETFDFSKTLKEVFSADFAQNECKYTLYAVVVHSGYAMCGHYTAYVRHRENKRWYYADDSHVEQVFDSHEHPQTSWEKVQTAYGGRNTAYMLMYRRDSEEEGRQPELFG
ncbi:ubl carboxyl-terminal hydrolase 18 isoform X2 [Archocentrus centrarchus]|uniref:ubl carboxyl-terminal hydrolase 18 isoform X2 n=1 Tax=Archocentrus centrarchus TaxID=63155 RepID=UPI0011E9EA12|nr:ubl carboxyl-terminal hydrolase 18 isoform X2 [Archocentrus centrarchus]